jgi:AraC family transcriptional regulator, regulatory protein of adaptative response / DNA-3-methyladenine glycosylase II
MYSAVVTTGIYCRPGCPARPLAGNVRPYDHPAAAEAAGFRACLRCRPYRVTGPLNPDAPEIVCRAVQYILEGALDEGTEGGLGEKVGLSARHLRRLFQTHLGASPDQIARSRRAHFARRLLDDTDLPVVDVAFASGFGSLRQFNRAMREIFRAPPSELRQRRRRADRLVADGGLALRVPVVPGYDFAPVLVRLAGQAIPGVESVHDGVYRRTIPVDDAPGLIEVAAGDDDTHLRLTAHLPYWEGLIHIVAAVSRLLGTEQLSTERTGGAWNAYEARLRATVDLADLAPRYGLPVPGLPGGLTHVLPREPGPQEDPGAPTFADSLTASTISSSTRSASSCGTWQVPALR